MATENARIRYRGDRAKKERTLIEEAGHSVGDAPNGGFFPQLWPRP